MNNGMARSQNLSKARPKRPATTPEGRENQLISMAIDLAEEQLRNGTASSQVITHFLRLGSTRERLEQEMLAHRTELVSAKTESLHQQERIEELYSEAIDAMRRYGGMQDHD